MAYGLVPLVPGGSRRRVFACVDSTRLGIGDPVAYAGSAQSIGNGPVRPTVSRSAATASHLGVCVGALQHTVVGAGMSLDRVYRPASVEMYVIVEIPEEQSLYYIESDEDSTTFAATHVGQLADLATVADCSTTSGMSTVQLDMSTVATTNTLGFQIVGYDENLGPGSTAPKPRLIVRFNQRSTIDTGGTGV